MSKVLTTPTGKTLEHPGRGMAYSHYGCRCDACRAYNTERCLRSKRKRVERGVPEGFTHGYGGAINYGCKCDVCTAAVKAKNAKWHRDHYVPVDRTSPDTGYPGSKLTGRDVLKICERLDAGETQVSLAEEYGVTHFAISRIARGKSWAQLTGRGSREH